MRSKIVLAIAALSAVQIGSVEVARACSEDPFAGTFFDCSSGECELVGGGSSTCQYTENHKSVPEPATAIAIAVAGVAIACSGRKKQSAK